MTNLMPYPSKLKLSSGKYSMDAATSFSYEPQFDTAAGLFSDCFIKKYGCPPKKGSDFTIQYCPFEDSEEYRLEINESGIKAFASTNAGAVYAVQTLRLLAKMDCKTNIDIDCCVIEDKPRYKWRGVSFDVARHFFALDEMKRFISVMSMMKLNVLHLHLTDDQGFRIQIDKYPLLTAKGAFREGTQRRDGRAYIDDKTHGGFYTKDELRELVAFAAQHGVEIVPEIDIPGHTVAMTAAMPELGCTGKETEVSRRFGIYKDILCAGKDNTYTVLQDIFDEIAEIFPSPYIHLGGDEAPKDNWKSCPYCLSKIKSLALDSEEDLQAYMFNYFADYLAAKGKIIIGWNECLEGAISNDIVCQHWTPSYFGKNTKTVSYINNGGKAIVSDFLKTYFDYPYAMTSLKKAYSFDPLTTLKGVFNQSEGNIMGGECNIWTEYIPDREKLDFNVFPRILAFAERMWSESKQPYSAFVTRLKDMYPILDILGIGYAKGMENSGNVFRRIRTIYKMFTNDAFAELKRQRRMTKQ